MPEVVALAAALADAGEHRVAGVELGDVVDELLDDDRLADARAAEDGRLAALGKRRDQIDDLDAGLEHLGLGGLLDQRWGQPVDGIIVGGLDRRGGIDGFAQDVENPAQGARPDRHGDRLAQAHNRHAAAQTIGAGHRDRAHPTVARLSLHFAHQLAAVVELDLQGVVDVRQILEGELHVHHRADDLDQFTDCAAFCHVCRSPFNRVR